MQRSWLGGIVLAICLSVLLPTGLLASEAPSVVFEVLSEENFPTSDGSLETHRQFLVTVHQGLIESDPDAVTVPLPDGGVAVAQRAYWQWISSDEYHWIGELRSLSGEILGGTLSLHYSSDRLFGYLNTPDGASYELSPKEGAHRLTRIADSGSGCGLHPAESGLKSFHGEAESAALESVALSDTNCIPTKNLVYVDVMVLYPLNPQLQATKVQNFATSKVAEANMLFTDSGVNIIYRLAYVGPITAEQPSKPNGQTTNLTAEQNLAWLHGQVNSSNPNTEIELLRKAHGADMIALVVPPHSDDVCGIATLPELRNGVEVRQVNGERFRDQAFVAVELNCGNADYTFAHELGHTFGMRHADNVPLSGRQAIYPWAYGFDMAQPGDDDATVMACFDGPFNCRRIRRFSNPDRPYNGRATGLHSSQSNSPAHNACVANKRADKYAGFVPLRPSSPPSLEITGPNDNAQVTAGVNLQFKADAFDPEDGNLAASVRWYSDREGYLGQGAPLTKRLTSGGDHLITAEVTDSSGTLVPYSIRLVVDESTPPVSWIDSPSNNQHVYGNWTVSGWSTDSSGVTTLSFKVDGSEINLSSLNSSVSRGDVCAAYSGLNDPNCPQVGFSGILNTEQFSLGNHTLQVIATDRWGNTSTFNRPFRKVQAKIFSPSDDAYVKQTAPNSSYGGDSFLYCRALGSGQARHTYLKFKVSGVGSPILSATLKMNPSSNITNLRLYNLTDDNWSENSLTWNNASLAHTGTFAAGSFSSGNEASIDVGSYITGNGVHTLGLTCADIAGQRFFSDDSLLGPKLVITY